MPFLFSPDASAVIHSIAESPQPFVRETLKKCLTMKGGAEVIRRQADGSFVISSREAMEAILNCIVFGRSKEA